MRQRHLPRYAHGELALRVYQLPVPVPPQEVCPVALVHPPGCLEAAHAVQVRIVVVVAVPRAEAAPFADFQRVAGGGRFLHTSEGRG